MDAQDISARLLGDPERYRELFADNQGVELGDGHVLTNPNLIWPGLHLRLPPEVALDDAPQPPSPVVPTPAPATSLPTTAAAPAPVAPEANGQPTSTSDGHGNAVATGLDDHREPTPAPSPLPADLPGASAPSEQPPAPGRAWGTDGPEIDLGVAGGLTVAAALLVLHARRRRRASPEPESDTRVDAQAFTVAEPAAVAGGRAAGTLDDPHGIVLGELLAGELVRRARVAELADVQVICVMAGRSGSVVTLSAPLQDRPLLEAALRTETQLARRIDVSRSPEQDIVVRLQGVRREALARVSLQDCPVLLCLGMLPDSRSCLVGWDAFGHVLVASQPGTTDAEQHLAALVAILAGQLSPADLHLYTVAGENSWVRQLIPLPHQRAATVATDTEAVTEILANLRREVERRQLAGDGAKDPQLVLVVSELADVCAHEDLAYLLSHGGQLGVRVIGATADSGVERGALVDQFRSHLVFGLQDEEASTRLLGAPWALTLAEPGRLLVRTGGRKEVEVLGLHLTEDGCRALLASMGVTRVVPPSELLESVSVREHESESPPKESAGDADNSGAATPDGRGPSPANVDGEGPPGELLSAMDQEAPTAVATVERRDPGEGPDELSSGSGLDYVVVKPDETTSPPGAAVTDGPPERIRRLLARAPLVVDCEEASVWSTRGRLGIGQSSPVEVLVHLAAAPLLHQVAMAEWPGVDPETLLAEIWAPRARDPGNRDSAQTWLAKNLGRLQDEIERAAGELDGQIVVKQRGGLHLNDEVVVSDLEAFMAAIERASATHGADHIRLAEDAFATRVPGLLSRVVRRPKTTGPRVEFYRWLGEPHWERAARRLDALGRESAMLVARAYREAGRHEEALAIYDELLIEDPLDRRAREGLLIAAAGTRDMVRLQQAWQQVCACLGGEDDAARMLYERLRCEVKGAASLEKEGRGVVAVARGSHAGGTAQ